MADILKISELLKDAGVHACKHPLGRKHKVWNEYRHKIANYLVEHGCNLSDKSTRPDKCSVESHSLFRQGGYSICPYCDENISDGQDSEELAVTDKLLEEQYRLMDEIPECPVHGKRCIPHAIEWISRVKTLGRIITRED